MRNLGLVTSGRWRLPDGLLANAVVWDTSNDSLICAARREVAPFDLFLYRSSINYGRDEPRDHQIATWTAAESSPDGNEDRIVAIQFFSDVLTACLIFEGGDIVIVKEDPEIGEAAVEIVGSVDVGIVAATWAPDQDLLSIVTKAESLILMTRDFEMVKSVELTANDLKASKHVSVGWGKKETQFQGKRAKAMRDPTMPESIDEGHPSDFEDGRTTISWRGDGAFLALNHIIPNDRRVIRVFSREGVLDSVTEPVNGLEGALSWRPSGDLISGIQRSGNQVDVVFFERNGLRHGEFSLRLTEDESKTWAANISSSWNVDSTVLAVGYLDRIHLWTRGNYHYYLKQEIKFDYDTSILPHSPVWHPEKPLKLGSLLEKGTFNAEFLSRVNRGSTARPFDQGIVAVIDGKSLKLTPLKTAMMPPPMSLTTIEIKDIITTCSISQSGRLIAVLTHERLEIYKWDFNARPIQAPQKVSEASFEASGLEPANILSRDILIQKEDKIWVLSKAEHTSLLSSYILAHSALELVESTVDTGDGGHYSESMIQAIFTDSNHESLSIQRASSLELLKSRVIAGSAFDRNQGLTEIVALNDQSISVDHGKASQWDGDDDLSQTRFRAFSLSRKGELVANSKLVASGCTSFITTSTHLLFTTSRHLLKFVHLNPANDYDVPADTPEADERCRSVERGARIVTLVPSIYAVVLQMPRGNLETVYPRALVLAGIRQHLDDKDFKAAFLACETHQVDMNIFWGKSRRIDLFLSKLSEEDVSKTLYRDTLVSRPPSDSRKPEPLPAPYFSKKKGKKSGTSKVNTICDALLAILRSDPSKNFQNIITSCVSKRPADLVSALELTASFRQKDAEKAEEAISHLCFLSDVNELYETALSLYDLPLTLLVAQQAQRDPREYVPFLQQLDTLPMDRRKFEVDDHLGKRNKALVSLHALAAHDEVEVYTKRHGLYTEVLKLYRYDSDHLTRIVRLQASYLSSQSAHLHSAIASESISDYISASESYAKCSPPRWREALHCKSMIEPRVPLTERTSLALQLANTLAEEQRDYRSASQIHIDYLSDPKLGASLLCKGSYFSEALRLLSLHRLHSEIPDVVDTALASKTGEISELVASFRSQISAQVPRITELRVKKAEDPLAFFGGDSNALDGGEADVADNVSLAPTDASTTAGQSLFTRYGNKSNFAGTVASGASKRSSKTRRKDERKRAMGKKGSVYEEEYLVDSVRRLVERVNGVQEEVRRLMEGLMRRGMRERVDAVQGIMEELVRACEEAVGQVWNDAEAGQGAAGSRTTDQMMPSNHAPPGMVNGGDLNLDGMPTSEGSGSHLLRNAAPEVKTWKSAFD